jgi:phage protein D
MAALISGTDIYAPVFTVKLVETGVKLSRDSITGIEINEDLENPSMFKVSLNESFDYNTQEFEWLDNDSITPGTEVIIYFGYASAPGKSGLIRGRIKALSPGFLSSGITTLNLEGYDLSHDLQKTEGDLSYSKITYSNVAQKIARDNNLTFDGIETTIILHKKIERKRNEKDFALLKRLSNEIGHEFFIRDKTVYFRKPKDNKDGQITFEFRKNFISFSPRMTTANLVNEVRVTAWNKNDKESISETAVISDIQSSVGIPDLDSIAEQSQNRKIKVRLEGWVVRSREEAKTLAIAELRRRNRGFIEGSLECIGDPQLKPGMTINIKKVGKRFSGTYYITKARHVIGDSGYQTSLDVRRSL